MIQIFSCLTRKGKTYFKYLEKKSNLVLKSIMSPDPLEALIKIQSTVNEAISMLASRSAAHDKPVNSVVDNVVTRHRLQGGDHQRDTGSVDRVGSTQKTPMVSRAIFDRRRVC